MFAVSSAIDIAVGPERVWRVLMDFANYRSWHPYVELEGSPVLGGGIDFYFRNNPDGPRGLKGSACVSQLEPDKRFGFKLGVPVLCMMEQWYALEATDGGTRVTYASNFHGALPAIMGGLVRKKLLLLHRVPIERLARGFIKTSSSSPIQPGKIPPKPRKGFRSYRAK